jgi:hypothetical protein
MKIITKDLPEEDEKSQKMQGGNFLAERAVNDSCCNTTYIQH